MPISAMADTSAIITVLALVSAMALIGMLASPFTAAMIGYPTHVTEVRMMLCVICLDTLLTLPFCYLRYIGEVKSYTGYKIIYGATNALLNFYVLYLCPRLLAHWPNGMLWDFYLPNNSLGYILGCNIITSLITFYVMIHEWKPFGHFHSSWGEIYDFRYVFDRRLFLKMLSYALPILGASLIDIGIQNIDRIIFPWLVPGEEGMRQLGIYGACFRIGMIMALATQVLRDIMEPALFRLSTSRTAVQRPGAIIVKYFIIWSMVIMLVVELGMGVIQRHLLVNPEYWEGLDVVPVLMCSEILVGLQFYMSFWYKLTDRPSYGTWFALITLFVILIVNLAFVPYYGYIACAWAIFAGTATRLMLTIIVGRQLSNYNFQLLGIQYMIIGLMMYAAMRICPDLGPGWTVLVKSVCLLFFLALLAIFERQQIIRYVRNLMVQKK